MSRSSQVRIEAEYALFRALTGGLAALSRPAAVATGRRLALAAFFALGHLRRIGECNLRIAFPRASRSEHLRILRASFDSLGRQLGEFCHFPQATVESLRKIVEYDPDSNSRFQVAKERGCGVLMITAHLGGWEFLPFAASAFGEAISFLARPVENPKIERCIYAVRTKFGSECINKKSAGLTCLRLLRKGGTLGVLSDLNSLPQEGVFTPFFGELACTTLAVAVLALPTDAAVFPVFAPYDATRGKYVFLGGPPIEVLRTGDYEQDLLINTARVASVIERTIRTYPEQWLWIHDRWHARPRPWDRVCIKFPPVDS
jgi:KDO2-lipid IV(A) lauroyltransferase